MGTPSTTHQNVRRELALLMMSWLCSVDKPVWHSLRVPAYTRGYNVLHTKLDSKQPKEDAKSNLVAVATSDAKHCDERLYSPAPIRRIPSSATTFAKNILGEGGGGSRDKRKDTTHKKTETQKKKKVRHSHASHTMLWRSCCSFFFFAPPNIVSLLQQLPGHF